MSIAVGRLMRRVWSCRGRVLALGIVAVLHAAALVVMLETEVGPVAQVTFLLVWLFLNFFWLTVLRRPGCSALISLAVIVVLIELSRFKVSSRKWLEIDLAHSPVT